MRRRLTYFNMNPSAQFEYYGDQKALIILNNHWQTRTAGTLAIHCSHPDNFRPTELRNIYDQS